MAIGSGVGRVVALDRSQSDFVATLSASPELVAGRKGQGEFVRVRAVGVFAESISSCERSPVGVIADLKTAIALTAIPSCAQFEIGQGALH